MNMENQIRQGMVYSVKAWWLRGNLCTCKIGSVYNDWCYVTPLEGNPHSRIVDLIDLVERIGGHAAETL